jgi:hypothetical protein
MLLRLSKAETLVTFPFALTGLGLDGGNRLAGPLAPPEI